MTDIYYVEATTAEEAERLADSPTESVETDVQPTVVEEILAYPPGAIVCPEGLLVDKTGVPRPAEYYERPQGE